MRMASMIHAPTMLNTSKKISLKLLGLMCQSNTAPTTLKKRYYCIKEKKWRGALQEFQSCFPSAHCLSLVHAIFSIHQGRFLLSISKLCKEENTKRFYDQWKGLRCYLHTSISSLHPLLVGYETPN